MSKRKKNGRASGALNIAHVPLETSGQTSVLKVGAPILILLLAAIGFGAFLNSTSPLMSKNVTRASAPVPMPTPDYSATKPAKEYVYGGGKLIAVTEPSAPSDLAVWRKSTGTWWVMDQDGSTTTEAFGLDGDRPAPGDYDGDGKTDFCVFRPSDGNWYLLKSGSGNAFSVMPFGNNGDEPAAADYNGDGKTEFGLFRPSNNTWYLQDTTQGYLGSWVFGAAGDKPVSSDYDGDGKADIAVWRNGTATWYVLQSSDSAWNVVPWGAAGDKPVAGDYDGDGKTDFAVWQANNNWYIRKSSTPTAPGSTMTWGTQASDIPVQGDYDSDGKTDVACWRPSNGTWYIINSSGGQRVQPWGSDGDFPVPAAYRR